MTTVASMLVTALADHGVSTVWGVVGDALNPVTDAIRMEKRLTWVGVRHEEAGAFAANAQAQLTGQVGVCMGTVGPGSVHMLNGLYDAKKSHAPVLAICGQVPSAEIGSEYFQEVDNDSAFRDVSVFCRTITDAAQLPYLLELAVNTAYARRGVAVLTLPGDVGGRDVPAGTQAPRFVRQHPPAVPASDQLAVAATALDGASRVAMLCPRFPRACKFHRIWTCTRTVTIKPPSQPDGKGGNHYKYRNHAPIVNTIAHYRRRCTRKFRRALFDHSDKLLRIASDGKRLLAHSLQHADSVARALLSG